MGSLPDFTGFFIFLMCLAPIAVWKVIEMVIWLFTHVSIN